ncbi:MAG: type II toxin-antitoxin system VapC family toxin [Thermoleophilaceae bacterium]|nr:type II toxin-antitoxin system VapC family toxin [Thermoleophilaceae bacterium]
MIVVDASAVLELLLRTPQSGFVADHLLSDDAEVHAPATLDLEIAGVLRRWELGARLASARAEQSLVFYLDQRIALHPPRPLLRRAWRLRGKFTSADALYLALAEALDAALLTTDQRLGVAAREHTAVAVIAP